MGWALDNLSADERRAIAEGLIVQGGGKVTQHESGRGELIARCPLHQEQNPSFSYSYVKDVFNCSSGCGGGDLVKLFAEVNGLANKEGFKQFKGKYGGGGDRPATGRTGAGKAKPARELPPKIIAEEDWAALPPLPDDWRARLAEKRGWTAEAITALGLRLWTAPQGEARERAKAAGLYLGRPGEKRIAIPVRDDQGRLVNVRLYLPGADESKVVSWGKGYGAARLWPVVEAA